MNDPVHAHPTFNLRRTCWIGFLTFMIRTWQDIVRWAVLTIAPPIITTALYFIVFGKLLGQRVGPIAGFGFAQYLMPGLIMLSVIGSAYSHAALSFLTAKFHRTLDEQMVSPLPSWMIVVNYVAGGVLRGVTVGVTVGLISLVFVPLRGASLPWMASALFLISLVSSLAGFLNAVFAKTYDEVNWVPTFVLTPLTYLSGIFYSVALLPGWARALSRANPIFYMVNLFRYGMLGVTESSIGLSVVSLLLATVLLFAVAAQLMARGTGIKD